jgi:hypothetical protein
MSGHRFTTDSSSYMGTFTLLTSFRPINFFFSCSTYLRKSLFILEMMDDEAWGNLHVLRREIQLELLLEVLDEVRLRRELAVQLMGNHLTLLGGRCTDQIFLLTLHAGCRRYYIKSI